MLNASLDLRQVNVALDDVSPQVKAMVETKMQLLVTNLQRHVIADKLQGQVLHHRSGKLGQSIQKDVATQGEAITGEVFSAGNLPYAAIHEFGGKTAPHDIVPSKADALAFMIGGRQVFAKIVHHPGSVIPERSYLRSSLADQASDILSGLKQAAVDGARKALKQ